MGCKCAVYDSDSGRYDCDVSGSGCIYLIPNSKRCANEYGEGPDANNKDSGRNLQMGNQTGTVKWFDEKKGWGFITTDENVEVFVHYSAINTNGFKTLKDGQRVQLTITQGEKGPQAATVAVIQ